MAKGLLLSVAITAVWGVAVIARLHQRTPQRIFRMMVSAFIPTIPVYGVLYWVTPPGLGVLPARLTLTPVALGFWNGLLFHLLFFLTIVQCFYHVNRSITLRLLTEFERASGHFLTVAELSKVYGLDQMIQNRVEAMAQNHFIEHRGGRYYLARKGQVFARIALLARAALKLKEV
jgi:hypothetical protein